MRIAPWFALALLAACAGDDPKDTDTDTDVTGETDTDVGETDVLGETGDTADVPDFEWPSSPDADAFTATTYMAVIDIPPSDLETPPTCCRDWGAASKDKIRDGTDEIDNALSLIQGVLGGLVSLEEQLDATVESGSFVALLEHGGLPTTGTGSEALGFFLGAFDDDTNYGAASTGQGYFLVEPSSFVPGTGRPNVVFPRADVTDDHLSASGGDFQIPLAFGTTAIEVRVRDVGIEADLDVGTDGVTMGNGELSGVIRLQDFFAAYNDIVATSCACAGLAGPLFEKTGGEWKGDCQSNGDVKTACPGSETLCVGLIGSLPAAVGGNPAGFCGLLGPALPNLADIDLDGDTSTFEALSVGLTFTGVPADVVGIAAENP